MMRFEFSTALAKVLFLVIFGRLQGLFNETKNLNFLFLNLGEGDMFSDPLKGPITARKIFWPLCFHDSNPCCRKPALREYLVTKMSPISEI